LIADPPIKESTNARILIFSGLSITAYIGLGVFQIYYLKRFFQQKKLL